MQAAGCDCDFPYHSCVFLARDVIDTPLPVAIIQAIRHADGGRGFEQDGRIGLSAQRVEEIRAQMSFRCVCHAPPPKTFSAAATTSGDGKANSFCG
jgi:hypothetical protein